MEATAGQLMTQTVVVIEHDTSVLEATQKMRDARIGSLLVKREGANIGILTETDVVRKAAAGGKALSAIQVHEVMSSPVLDIDSDLPARYAIDMMANAEIRHLAVREQDEIVGLLSVRDILMHFKAKIVISPDMIS